MDYEKLMNRARATNHQRDATDRQMAPFHTEINKRAKKIKIEPGAPADQPLEDHIRTAMFAIECGIKTDDWTAVAEAQAMLEEIYQRMTGSPWQ